MRYAVLGDIHGNLEALREVVADARGAGVDAFWCVGDIVGYGADPAGCLARVRELEAVSVAGNHDWAAAGRVGVECFNADARDSVEWTRRQLDEPARQFLAELQLVHEMEDVTLVHGSPFSPEYFEYLQTTYDVQVAFDHLKTRLCFVGHSHVPVVFLDTTPVEYFVHSDFTLPDDRSVIVNVGSVGQPRDLDPRACYVIYDDQQRKVRVRRLEYDLQSASERMMAAGLPSTNAARIVLGR